MSFPLLFAWIPFSNVPIPSSGLLKSCFANSQFTCQIAVVGRLLWVPEEMVVLIRDLVHAAGTERSTRLLFGSVDAISSVQALARVPQAGLPPGQGSHPLSLGNVALSHCSSAMQGMCHQQSLTVPFSRAGSAALPTCSWQTQAMMRFRTPNLASPALQSDNGMKMEGRRRNFGEAAQCWRALKADSFAPDVLNHMWRSVCGQMLLETDC